MFFRFSKIKWIGRDFVSCLFLPALVSIYFECYRVRWDYDTYDWNCERWDNRIELATKFRERQFDSRSLLWILWKPREVSLTALQQEPHPGVGGGTPWRRLHRGQGPAARPGHGGRGRARHLLQLLPLLGPRGQRDQQQAAAGGAGEPGRHLPEDQGRGGGHRLLRDDRGRAYWPGSQVAR